MPKINSSNSANVRAAPYSMDTTTLRGKIDEINEKLISFDNKDLSQEDRVFFKRASCEFISLYRDEINSKHKEIFKEIMIKCSLKAINFNPETAHALKNQENKFSAIENFSPNKYLKGNGIQDYKDTLYHNYVSHLLESKSVTSEIADEAHRVYDKVINKEPPTQNIVEKLQVNFQELKKAIQQMTSNESISVDISLLNKNFNDLREKHKIDISAHVIEDLKQLREYSSLEKTLKESNV
ncbi:hypothetical protein [Candidatus Fukatsuia endosymbiont of Tuberolachnus salignus]|uniref:hypothetical protein n=1 Tax=Candidatus Fukatsuia endosymbiont of Tuberolachnus salignus TaxID=3077957 RepID=UPI00313CB58F